MKMHFVAAVAVALAQLCLGAESIQSTSSKDQQGSNVWIHFDGKWVSAPKDVGPPGLKDAPVTLITFANDGRFFMLQCWISTYEGGEFRISPGNPYRAFEGEWADVNGRRQITYRLKNVEHVQPPNDRETTFRFESAIGEATLEFGGKAYRPSKRKVVNLEEFESNER